MLWRRVVIPSVEPSSTTQMGNVMGGCVRRRDGNSPRVVVYGDKDGKSIIGIISSHPGIIGKNGPSLFPGIQVCHRRGPRPHCAPEVRDMGWMRSPPPDSAGRSAAVPCPSPMRRCPYTRAGSRPSFPVRSAASFSWANASCSVLFRTTPYLRGALGQGADDGFHTEHVAEKGTAPGEPSSGGQVLELVEKHILPAMRRFLAGKPDRQAPPRRRGSSGRNGPRPQPGAPEPPRSRLGVHYCKAIRGIVVFFQSRATA